MHKFYVIDYKCRGFEILDVSCCVLKTVSQVFRKVFRHQQKLVHSRGIGGIKHLQTTAANEHPHTKNFFINAHPKESKAKTID